MSYLCAPSPVSISQSVKWSHQYLPQIPSHEIGCPVRIGHGTTDYFQIGKGVCQGCILSPCLFKLFAENVMKNAGLEKAQAGIKMAGRNIKNLRYADDTTLMAESVKRS